MILACSQHCHGTYQMVIFLFPLFFLYCKEEIALLTVWSVTYISMNIYFNLWIMFHYYHYFFVHIILHLAIKNSFTLDPVPFVLLLLFFRALIFWHRKMFQTYLSLSLPQRWNRSFSQGAQVLFIEE